MLSLFQLWTRVILIMEICATGKTLDPIQQIMIGWLTVAPPHQVTQGLLVTTPLPEKVRDKILGPL